MSQTEAIAPRRAPGDAPRAALSAHMRAEVRAPLAALRAVLEGVRHERRAFVDRALDELVRVDRAVEDLWSWCAPRPERRMSTTVGELVAAIVGGLHDEERRRLWVVAEDAPVALVTDGPLVVDAALRLARSSFVARDREAMLHAHADDEGITLSLVDDPGDDAGEGPADAAPDLALLLARRDVAALGGSVSVHRTGPEHRCVVLRLPLHVEGEVAA